MLLARISARRASFGCLAAVLITTAVLWPSGTTPSDEGQSGSHRSGAGPISLRPAVEPTAQPTAEPKTQPFYKSLVWPAVRPKVPGPLIDPALDLRAGPVDVPLELRIPSVQINAPVIGVGMTAKNVMDAPKGPAADPVWQKAFWYRGSGIPGELGTATFAGHVDDVLGRPAVFARLKELRAGDMIVVHDTRSGIDVHFTVAKTATYSDRQAANPSVLAQIYGSGPVSGKGPQPAADGLAHLTLITCSGSFVNGSYDRRLVVYATRSESK